MNASPQLVALSSDPSTLAHWRDHSLAALVGAPFSEPREFWVLLSNSGSLLGRIGACISASNRKVGYLGFFDVVQVDADETASILLAHACAFLKSRGASKVVGPLHLNTWLPYRFGLPHPDPHSFVWEPKQPESYPELWKKNGFGREMLYASEGHADLAALVTRLEESHKKARSSGFTFRAFDADSLLDKELPILHAISMRGFADNFMFEPLPQNLFRELYVPLAGKNAQQNLRLSGFVLSPEGREVGFAFSFLDGKRVILKTATVLPEYRGRGLSNALFFETLRGLDFSVHTEFVSALVRDGAQSESYGKRHARLWRHEYELLSKSL